MVMLGCTVPIEDHMKGVKDNQIHRDCRQNVFPGADVYTVQPSGWMDGEAFQECVQCFVWLYGEVHNNNLYLLLDHATQ